MEPQVNSFVYMLSWYLWNTDLIGILVTAYPLLHVGGEEAVCLHMCPFLDTWEYITT